MRNTKEYSNGEVTILWKPDVCIHSAKCVKQLPEVFKPKDIPWVQMEHASAEAIVKAVKGCPSGALSYFINTAKKEEISQEVKSEPTKVEIINNGPLMVYGELNVTHADGREEQKTRATAFCRCGKTGNNPFCDGSHKR